jgi:hypothetical protein
MNVTSGAATSAGEEASMAKRTPARAQFLTDTLTTAIEGGINYWAGVLSYHWWSPDLEGGTAEHEEGVANAHATICDNELDGEVLQVTLDTMAHGWTLFAQQYASVPGDWAEAIKANRTNSEDGDFDAQVADMVLQLGLFGEVIYG